jgi:membrane fusion protein (multidrug efflux system)
MTRFRWELLLMLALAVLTVWLATGERLPIWLVGEREIPVRVARVTKQSIAETVRMSGVLTAVNEVHAVSQLAGRISELRFKVGDSVRAGAVVATIHASAIAQRQSELEAALRAARKDLSAKESQLASAEKFAAHRQKLFKQDLIARRDMEQALAALQTVRAEAELARAHLAQQEAMLAQALKIQSLSHITAPSAGVVSRRWAEPGAVIAESSPVLSIANGNLMKFSGRISGANAALLREGLSAVVLADESIDGIVSRLISSGEKNDASAEVEIQIKTAVAKFRFGMAAQASITLARASETLRVPQSAIIESAGKHFLYKLAGGRALRQEVKLGAREGNEVVVEQGVSASELVIVDNLHSLKPASRVRAAAGAPEGNSAPAK